MGTKGGENREERPWERVKEAKFAGFTKVQDEHILLSSSLSSSQLFQVPAAVLHGLSGVTHPSWPPSLEVAPLCS